MQIPSWALGVARALWAQAPPQSEDDCRAFMRRVAEQLRHDTGERWGVKRAGPGRPLTKDLLPRAVGSSFEGWDLITAASLPSRAISEQPSYHDAAELAGQVFEDVSPMNHLGGVPAPPPAPVPIPPTPVPPSNDLAARVAALETRVNKHLAP